MTTQELDELIKEIPTIRNYYAGSLFTTATTDINNLCDAIESFINELAAANAKIAIAQRGFEAMERNAQDWKDDCLAERKARAVADHQTAHFALELSRAEQRCAVLEGKK